MRKRRGVTKPTRPTRYGSYRQRALDYDNPRFTRRTGRTGRLPLTLIDGSTVASAAEGIRIFSAAIHFSRPCWAQTLQRYAAQIENGWDEDEAIVELDDEPGIEDPVEEGTFSSSTFSERTFSESGFDEPEF
jgi:hypothetical protein